MNTKPITLPASLRRAPIGPLPQGLSGWLARIADRASNSADRRDLAFHSDIAARFGLPGKTALAPTGAPERLTPAAEAPAVDGAPPGLLIADLHSDTLLWGVDPWRPRASGHMDLPRLFDARVGLQVFGGPTWTPLPMKNREQALCVSCESIDQSDALFPSQWLDRVRRSKAALRRRRAYRLAERFNHMLLKDANQRLLPVFKPEDLDRLFHGLGAHGPKDGGLGVMLSLEGLHWIEPEDDVEHVREEVSSLRAAGYRMIAPTHRFSNGLGGASEDCSGRMGLTRAGRAVVNACFDMGVAVDLAHASPAMIREAAGLALNHHDGPRPLIVSHAGVRATHREARNLRDADIRAVVSTGGLIGVGVWFEAIGFAMADSFEAKIEKIVDAFVGALDAISHPDFVEEMVDRYGRYDPYEHLAIGSDFDGATATPFDVTGLSWLLAALAKRERNGEPIFPTDKLRLIAGENTRRVLRRALS